MNISLESLPQLTPDARRSSRTLALCRARLEQRRRRPARVAGVVALGGIATAYLLAIVLNALRLYSSS
jgi:hypothetical protein